MSHRIARSLVFPVDSPDPKARWLFVEFPLLVNRSIGKHLYMTSDH